MDLSEYIDNNNANLLLFSDIPDSCKTDPCVLGIDEAGRGPVLGPMVYACAFCPVDKKQELKDLGVDDSKALTEAQRDQLLQKVLDNGSYLGWAVHVLSPHFISTSMYRRGKYNLNSMSHDTAIDLIRQAVDKGVRVAEVYVDTVGPPEKYQAKIQACFPNIKVTVAKKADSLYPCVSAASICAKTARDKVLKEWKFAECDQEGGVSFSSEWGSGYPGDPVTKKFLQESMHPMFGFPSIVRFSWKTAEKILEEKGAEVNFEEVEPEDEESVKRNPSVKEFFVVSQPKKKSSRTHPYFTERGLKSNVVF